MALVQFKKGLLSQLPVGNAVDGALYITTDEGGIYLGNSDKSLKRLGDFIVHDNIDALNTWKTEKGASKMSEQAMHYAKAENVLARWDAQNSRWIQINAAGLTKVAKEGTGNVVSNLKVTTDSLTGAMVLTFETESVATSETMEEALDAIATLQTDVGNLKTLTSTHTTQITNLGTRITNELSALETELRGGYTGSMSDLNTAVDNAQSAADDAADAAADVATDLSAEVTRAKAAEKTLTDNLATTNSNLTAEVNRATAKENELAEDITEANEAIGDLESALAAEVQRSTNKDTAHDNAISTANSNISKNATDIAAEKSRAEGAEAALGSRIDDTNTDLSTLENTVDGHTSTLATHAGWLNILRGNASTEGSVAYQIAQIVAGADANFDTLKEIADWIAAHPDSVSALQSQITDNAQAISDMASDVADLQSADEALDGRIDTLEAAVGTGGGVDARIEAALAAILGCATTATTSTFGQDYDTIKELVAKLKAVETKAADNATNISENASAISTNASAISTETTRAKAAEKTLTDNLATTNANLTAETNRATAAETALGSRIDDANADIADVADDLAAEITRAKGAETTLTNNLSAEVTRAKNAESALGTRIDTTNQNVATNATNISNNATSIQENADSIADLWAALEWGSFTS